MMMQASRKTVVVESVSQPGAARGGHPAMTFGCKFVMNLVCAFDQVRFGVKMPDEVPMVLQERANTSPIWYTP